MTSLLVVLGLTVVAMPAPGGGKSFDHGRMAARPLADQTLPAGTISVLVRKGREPAVGLKVALVPTGATPDKALLRGTTNAEGRLFLKAAAHAGQQARVAVRIGAKDKWSVPFTVPRVGGVRFLFLQGGAAMGRMGQMGQMGRRPPGSHGHDHGKPGGPAPIPKARGEVRWLQLWVTFEIIAIEKQELYVSLTYTVLNRGPSSYHPGAHGLLLPVPEGMEGVSLPQGSAGAEVGKKGILVTREVGTGRHGLQLRANGKYKHTGSELPMALHSPLPLIGYAVVIKAYPRVRIVGPRLGPPDLEKHAGHGVSQRIYRSTKRGFPRQTLTFTIRDLPVRSRSRSWPFAVLALALVLAGLGLALLRRRPGSAPDPPEPPTALGNDLDELVRIERDRRLGVLDEDSADKRTAVILTGRAKVAQDE